MVENGFRGKIYCSEATFDLCKILLPDSGFLHEEDAKQLGMSLSELKEMPADEFAEKFADELDDE